MKKLLLGSLVSLLLINATFAVSTYEYEDTLSDFDVQTALKNMNDLKSSVDVITKELFDLDDKERNDTGITEKYRETREEIVRVINDIDTTTQQVGTMLSKIALYKKQIFITNKDLKTTREGLEDAKEYAKNFSNFLYKIDNDLYSEQTNDIDELKLLIKSDNIPETLAQDYLTKAMLLQFNELLNDLNAKEKRQIALIKNLNNLKIETQDKVKDYHVQLEKLQQKKNYLVQFMELYKNDRFRNQSNIQNLFDSIKDVHETTMVLVDDIQKETHKLNFDLDEKRKELEEATKDVKFEERNPVAWPLYPITNIQKFFGDNTFQKQYGVPHLGVQITAQQGTPVYAAQDGIVYHVSDNEGIGINRILILHDKGYVTTYTYMNKINTQVGNIVRRGELIGYSGGEPGTKGAGFISQGANLTFGVFKDGIAIDSLELLDLSVMKDKSILADNYHIKYLNDKYARPIDITNVNFMEGNSVSSRAYSFLDLYGVGIYKELAFWEDAVKGTNIDRDVVLCIGFAESTLGRYLTTANNIGNVGNNDRGDRVGYSSALDGARLIADTLNNQFLGHYHTIKQLSRYGNKEGYIYASSSINWQTNVLKCLSQIKGYYIPEDYPFRIGTNPNHFQDEIVEENPNEKEG